MIGQIIEDFHKYPFQIMAAWTFIQGLLTYGWSAFTDSLEPPTPEDTRNYRVFYTFAHKISGNLTEVQRQKEAVK